ncbi:MAG: cytochrome c biogenesis protein ResB, partial [Pseudomonadota bacterium]
ENLPFKVRLLDKCENCLIEVQDSDSERLQGLAQNMKLTADQSRINIEENFSGLTLDIEIDGNEEDSGQYILLEDFPENLKFGDVEFMLTREETELPFEIQLKDFEKIDYPGTSKAEDYHSSLIIHENGLSWPAFIEMNKPYRYKGYTLYQSSFEILKDREVSVLSIVSNKGRLIPYIAIFIIFLGLGIHSVIRIRKMQKS